jgi:hypothetical protein
MTHFEYLSLLLGNASDPCVYLHGVDRLEWLKRLQCPYKV